MNLHVRKSQFEAKIGEVVARLFKNLFLYSYRIVPTLVSIEHKK